MIGKVMTYRPIIRDYEIRKARQGFNTEDNSLLQIPFPGVYRRR